MKKYIKGSGLGLYAEMAAAGAAVIALVVYLVYNGAIGKITTDVLTTIVIGVAASCVALTTNFKFAPVISVLATSAAIGLYFNDRVIMFEELVNHITGMTERDYILPVVILIFVLLFVSTIASVVASFCDKKAA